MEVVHEPTAGSFVKVVDILRDYGDFGDVLPVRDGPMAVVRFDLLNEMVPP